MADRLLEQSIARRMVKGNEEARVLRGEGDQPVSGEQPEVTAATLEFGQTTLRDEVVTFKLARSIDQLSSSGGCDVQFDIVLLLAVQRDETDRNQFRTQHVREGAAEEANDVLRFGASLCRVTHSRVRRCRWPVHGSPRRFKTRAFGAYAECQGLRSKPA